MIYCDSKRTPAATRIQFGMARTKTLTAITHWVREKGREGATCDLRELTPGLIAELLLEINASAGREKSNSKLYYPDAFVANTTRTGSKRSQITLIPESVRLEYHSLMLSVPLVLTWRMTRSNIRVPCGPHLLKLAITVTITGRSITS